MAQSTSELKAFLMQAADEWPPETYTYQTYHEIIERLTSLEEHEELEQELDRANERIFDLEWGLEECQSDRDDD